jgi:phosphoribosyl 1,2-cyclic phosphodiesterase
VRTIFWGTRGSLPASVTAEAVRRKIVQALKEAKGRVFQSHEEVEAFVSTSLPFSVRGGYGTNTSSIEIKGGKEYILCDAGTGLRDFGNHVLRAADADKPASPKIFNIFISHLHWDHIQGFPFFTPAYIPGNRINIYGGHREIREAFVKQQEEPNFPVPLSLMRADIRFEVLEPGRQYEVAGLKMTCIKQNHPGDSYGYRFEKDGKTVVYSTDCEHKEAAHHEDYEFMDFFRDADLLIFDAQYDLIDAIYVKENWGHSSNIIAVELSVIAGVKHLCLYHNEPTMDDERLDAFLQDTRLYLNIYAEFSPLRISMAYDGLEVEV